MLRNLTLIRQDKLNIALIWFSVFYCAQSPSWLFVQLTKGIFLNYLFLSFAKPFVLFSVSVLLWLKSGIQRQRFLSQSVASKLCLVAIILIAVEIYHLPSDMTAFEQFKFVFYSKIVATFLSVCFFIAICEMSIDFVITPRFYSNLTKLLSFTALFSLCIALLSKLELIPIEDNNVIFNNTQSYESLAVLFFIVLNRELARTLRMRCLYVLLNAMPMFVFWTKGAALIYCAFFIGFFGIRRLRKLVIINRVIFVTLAVIFVLAGLQLAGYNVFTTKVAQEQQQIKYYDDNNVQIITESIVQLIGKISSDKTADKFNLSLNSTLSKNKSFISAYTRIGTIFLVLKRFIDHPIMGIGSFHAYNLEVGGFGIHSLLPLFLVSFGLIGFVPLVISSYIFVRSVYYFPENQPLILAVCSFVFLVMLFINQFLWWYALVAVALKCQRYSSENTPSLNQNSSMPIQKDTLPVG